MGRNGCNVRAVTRREVLPGTDLAVANVSEYRQTQDFDFSGVTFNGYDFGEFGIVNGTPVASTRTFEFNYMLDPNDPFNCADPNTADVNLVVEILGDERYLPNFAFDNFAFEGTAVPATDVTIDRSALGVLVTIDAGSAATNTSLSYTFDVTLDTALCAPEELLIVNSYLTTDCNGPLDCGPVRTCSSSFIKVDPDNIDCPCDYELYVDARRKNYDFTDNTRSIRQNADGVAVDNTKRFVSGDTVIFDYRMIIREQGNPLMNESDRALIFRVDQRISPTFANTSSMPALMDVYTMRLNSIGLSRADGSQIDFGDLISGPVNGLVRETGVAINGITNTVYANAYQPGEPETPALPNGGYTYGLVVGTADQTDGARVDINFRNFAGEKNGLQPIFDGIGGEFLPLDTIKMQLEVVLVDNPGWDGNASIVEFQPNFSAFAHVGPNVEGNRFRTTSTGICIREGDVLFYESPEVTGTSEIEYLNDCEAEMVASFSVNNLPADWYTDEHRLVAGLEDFVIDIPAPYYYAGGATIERTGAAPMPIEPDSSLLADTLLVGGQQILFPAATIGQLKFVDAELLDGVRPLGYAGFGGPDEALNDVTTVGGTFPLIGFQGGQTNELTFRIPLLRACGDQPTGVLEMEYSAANLYLPDLFGTITFFRQSGYWDGLVTNNNGDVVDPVQGRYFPFARLDTTGGLEISRERQTDIAVPVNIIGGLPAQINETAAVGNTTIIDMAGPETNTYTLCPEAGTTLTGGVLQIEVDASVDLRSITGDATAFTLADASEDRRIYSVVVPAGTAPDGCFNITLETELLFCDEAGICLRSIPGCSPPTVSADQQAAIYDGLMLDCATETCYQYSIGSTQLDIAFDGPVQADLCSTQSYGILFTNSGTGEITDFMPTLYLPEGFEADPASFSIGLLGGTATAVTAPVANPDSNAVVGAAFLFNPAEVATALGGTATIPPGSTAVITFDAATTCDFVEGSVIGAKVNARNVCEIPFSVTGTSSPLRIVPGAPTDPVIDFALPENIQVSCTTDGSATELLVTALNTGKGDPGQLEVMVTLPDGISLDLAGIEIVAPEGFPIDDAAVTLPGGGISVYSFTGPDSLPPGSALCFHLPLIVDGAECGVYTAGLAVKQRKELVCQSTGMTCDVASVLSESGFFELEVVPPVVPGSASSLTANCGATPGTFDLVYDLELLAPSDDFSGTTTIELYQDVNANGAFEAGIDLALGAPVSAAITIDSGGVTRLTGSFDGVDEANVCPALVRVLVPGCMCSESVLPITNVNPSVLAALGRSVALCPGETLVVEDACADLDFIFSPTSSGTATKNPDGSLSLSLNEGVSAGELVVSGNFGNTAVNRRIPVVSPMLLNYRPYTVEVCADGSEQVDLGVPVEQQEDLEVVVSPTTNIDNPNSFEPVIRNLTTDATYNVTFRLPGGCETTTTLQSRSSVPAEVSFRESTACLTGVDLAGLLTVSPADLTGTITTTGDGTFTTGNLFPGVTEYIPGEEDIQAGEVSFRFVSDDPDGSCGPAVSRSSLTVLLVECGSFFWNGQDD